MSDERRERLNEVVQILGKRKVAWFGTRGLDAAPLSRLGILGWVHCQIAPLGQSLAAVDITEKCLEESSGIREDLNTYDIDTDNRIEAVRFRRELLSVQGGKYRDQEWFLVAYRPAEFLAALTYTKPQVTESHMFFAAQRVFEHKPWVERQLKEIGLKTVDWQYAKDGESYHLRSLLDKGNQIVIRASRSDGGAKLALVSSFSDIADKMPNHSDGFFAYSPFYEGALPLNLNACVYNNKEVRVFHTSLQLIGLNDCTDLTFGFCGNDFGAAGDLSRSVLLEAELIAHRVGKWAADHGYLGVFGLDLLVVRGELHITEINPRFQASTYLSETIAEKTNISGPYLEHMAAFLGMQPPSADRLPNLVNQMAPIAQLKDECDLSQIIFYNDRSTDVKLQAVDLQKLERCGRVVGLPSSHVIVRPRAMLAKLIASRSVTEDGYSLRKEFSQLRDAFSVRQMV